MVQFWQGSILEPDAPQGAALYNCRGRTLNGWGKYGHNIQAGYSSELGLWLNSWHSIGFWHNECGLMNLKFPKMISVQILMEFVTITTHLNTS